ncbi:hypothetical protein L7F22_059432 [Adiantum nelumboides]|nr:hypothetical protein [Adiantum nelumboides]
MQTDSENEDYDEQRRLWTQEQDRLKGQLILHDSFPWKACGALVVVNTNTMNVIYEDFTGTRLSMRYIPGFLAFRESPILLMLLEKLAREHMDMYPQVLMVDGNGILHPRGFGLASHIGVLANLPTIGVAKNLYHVDGLCKEELRMACDITDTTTPLIVNSGQVLGMALRSHPDCTKPIFVSVGHRISLGTAVRVVQKCCKYRIPEPIRQADIRSRKQIKGL